MGLWWFCFIQWPLFMLYIMSGVSEFFAFPAKSLTDQLESLYGAYMLFFAPYMPLPIILTIILVIRRQKGKNVNKLENRLAIGSWVLSLLASFVLVIQGGFRT